MKCIPQKKKAQKEIDTLKGNIIELYDQQVRRLDKKTGILVSKIDGLTKDYESYRETIDAIVENNVKKNCEYFRRLQAQRVK